MIAFISQPMAGLTDEEILRKRQKATENLSDMGYTAIDSFFQNDPPADVINIGAYYLARSIEEISKSDAVYFCDGWENARGCVLEHKIAEAYNINCLYEDKDTPKG